MEDWIGAHIRAFEFLGGVPKLVIPDNTRTGVSRACRYEPDLNRTYHELAMHYGVGVLPARPQAPRQGQGRDGVQIVQRWIVAALRHRKFFSLAELNQASGSCSRSSNQRPFRKRPGCRASLFQELDRPALQPLPRRALRASMSGPRPASTSTITWSSTATTTACLTCSPGSWWRSGRR